MNQITDTSAFSLLACDEGIDRYEDCGCAYRWESEGGHTIDDD